MAAAAAACALACGPVAIAPAQAEYIKSGTAKGVDNAGIFGPVGSTFEGTFSLEAGYYVSGLHGDATLLFAEFAVFDTQGQARAGNFCFDCDGYIALGSDPLLQITIDESDFVQINNTQGHDIGFYNVNGSFYGGAIPGVVDRIELYSDTGSAPEPGTWALMMLGVSLAGLALRQRSPTNVAQRTRPLA